MAKILCAWELGGGFGHLTRLLPVARALQQAGHEVVIAVPDPDVARTMAGRYFPEGTAPLIKGIRWRAANDPDIKKKPTPILADVLSLVQFSEFERLAAMVRVWRRVLETHKPDMIVADFAPTLRLAAWESRPFIVIGSGYTVPPAGRLLPPIKPWLEVVYPFSRIHEAEVWQAVNRIRRVLKGSAIDYVSDLFNGDASFVCSIPEFDPYQAYRQQASLMPFNVPVMRHSPPVASRGERAPIFVYLASHHPFLKMVLQQISITGWPTHAYISGVEPEKLVKLAGKNISLHRQPLNLEENLWKFRLIIHHGGMGTTYAAVKAGTPQLLLPIHLEDHVTAHGLKKIGGSLMQSASAGKMSDPSACTSEFAANLQKLLQPSDLWHQAQQAAIIASKRPESDGVQVIVDRCLECLSSLGTV
ncbi:MAG: hypothetical protein JXR80_00815 [Deltaproteobacteria bacterium]|nr:hypothetical protein [Deltaproteobacteria bacterium]